MATKPVRHHFSWGQKEYYADYLKFCKEEGVQPISKAHHKRMLEVFYLRVAQYVVSGNVFVMPQKLGALSISVRVGQVFVGRREYRKSGRFSKVKSDFAFQSGTFFSWTWKKSGFFQNSGVYRFKRRKGEHAESRYGVGRGLFRKVVQTSNEGRIYPRR
jgi:hypothetical protein